MNNIATKNPFNIIVIVAALGYFVDIYDLILFTIVRVQSLTDIGITDKNEITNVGAYLMNWQMTGMLIGGIIWGILGDKKGRVSVLFGSILMYSLANILNGMVNDIETYKWLRLVAGIGLAGELGAGITLVSETMTKETRGYGTMIVVSLGVMGAILAAFIGKHFHWRTAYYIGGGLGLLLLVLRIGVYESGMFKSVKEQHISRGNFFQLFKTFPCMIKYLSCISIGLPIWFVIGILIFYSREFGVQLGISETIDTGTAVMYSYLGLGVGDFMSGYLSQLFKNRKKIVLLYLITTVLATPFYLYGTGANPVYIYFLCFMLGIAAGYWAVFITIASEQFGTNIRSTVTTTVPNFVRGAVVPLNLGFIFLKEYFGIVNSALIVGAVSLLLAIISLLFLDETYGKELDYIEEDTI